MAFINSVEGGGWLQADMDVLVRRSEKLGFNPDKCDVFWEHARG